MKAAPFSLFAIILQLLVPAAGAAGPVARECTVWETVAETLKTGKHGVWETVCNRSPDCTGVNCTDLAERSAENRNEFHYDPVQFSIQVLPCSYPLAMQLSLGRYDAPMFTKQIGIHSSGEISLDLPSGSKSANVVKRLEMSWISTLRPIRYQVELQINYTTYQSSGFVWTTLRELERIRLVPRIIVPVPDCTNRFNKPVFTTAAHRATSSPSLPDFIEFKHSKVALKPLFIGIGVAVFTLVLLLGIVLQRHWSATRRDTSKHVRLINECDVDGHMIQV